MLDHDPGPRHPERPERLAAVLEDLREEPVPGTVMESAPAASVADAELVHSASYVATLEYLRGQRAQLDPDTPISSGSFDAAMLAAGCAIAAAEAALSGERSFALVRPPGHHAERSFAMGFCLLNNIAIAAEHALKRVDRVLIVDWDVHHGNGTQHHFEARDDVLFFSCHRGDFYPGTGGLHERGRGPGLGYTLNVPLPAGSGDGDFGAAITEVLAPAAARFAPDLVLVSAGFDAHRDDPLGGLEITDQGFAALCGEVLELAPACALILEGGYDLGALTRSVRATLGVLAGGTAPPLEEADVGREAVSRAVGALSAGA
jgi:acetoin utilization deacetylase AcuC-like enzyme